MAGAVLFVFGVREISRKAAHSPMAMRFFLYLGIVILSLGNLAGCAKLGKNPVTASPSAAAAISIESQIGTYYKELQQAARKPTPDRLKSLDAGTAEAINKVDQLFQQKVISREAALYLRDLFNAEFESRKNTAGGKIISREEMIKSALNHLNGLDRVLSELNGTRQFDPFLCRILKSDVKKTFTSLREIPLKDRLEYGSIGRSDYRELVSRVQDNLFLYFQKSTMLAVTATTTIDDNPDHRTYNKYGVRPVEPPNPSSEYAVRPIDFRTLTVASSLYKKGDLWLKQPGKAWVALAARESITTVSVIENRGDNAGSYGTPGNSSFTLLPGAVFTGWEVQSGTAVTDLLQE